MANLILRALTGPAEQACDGRLAGNAKQIAQLRSSRRDELLIAVFEPLRISAAAQEPAQQHVTLGCTAWPFRRDPGAGEEGRPLDAWHDESGALHRMGDLFARVAERHCCCRG